MKLFRFVLFGDRIVHAIAKSVADVLSLLIKYDYFDGAIEDAGLEWKALERDTRLSIQLEDGPDEDEKKMSDAEWDSESRVMRASVESWITSNGKNAPVIIGDSEF